VRRQPHRCVIRLPGTRFLSPTAELHTAQDRASGYNPLRIEVTDDLRCRRVTVASTADTRTSAGINNSTIAGSASSGIVGGRFTCLHVLLISTRRLQNSRKRRRTVMGDTPCSHSPSPSPSLPLSVSFSRNISAIQLPVGGADSLVYPGEYYVSKSCTQQHVRGARDGFMSGSPVSIFRLRVK